ncbi:MAG: hypothetical protein AAGE59_25345 [Cyanobacteria bacterium P01_F01_bin.86]
MKILKHTDTELALSNQPFSGVSRVLSLSFLGLYSGISLAVMLSLSYSLGISRLECKRLAPKQVNCTLRRSQWLDLIPGRENSFLVIEDSNSSSVSYGQDVWSDNDVFVPHETRQSFAKAIKAFVLSDATSLTLEQDHRSEEDNAAYLFLASLMAMGGLLAMGFILFRTDLLESETLVFKKSSQQLNRVTRHPLLGARTAQYPLHMIHHMSIQVRLRKGKVSHYKLMLLTEEGQEILLLRNECKLLTEQTRDAIHAFLALTTPKKAIVDPRNR